MSAAEIRLLQPDDQPALDRYLALRPMTTMFLRGNLLAMGGIGGDPTQPYGGLYAGVIDGDEIVGAAGFFWNDNVILESDTHQAELVRTLLAGTGRGINGFLGPAGHVGPAINDLGLKVTTPSHHSAEILYAVDLERLRVPPILASGAVECRRASAADRQLRTEWRVAFMIEGIGATDSEELRREAAEGSVRGEEAGRSFILYAGDEPVSISGFNTKVPDCVQIGGVYTPPDLRSRGYARAVVAGSLLLAQEQGVSRSVLFTDHANVAAQKAYEALGYEPVGDYALVFWDERQRLT